MNEPVEPNFQRVVSGLTRIILYMNMRRDFLNFYINRGLTLPQLTTSVDTLQFKYQRAIGSCRVFQSFIRGLSIVRCFYAPSKFF